MKKLLSMLLAIFIVFTTVNIFAAASSSQDYNIWVAPNTVKVLQDQEVPENPKSLLEFEAAKNESESGQIIVSATKDINIKSVTITNLTSLEQNATINKDTIKIYVQSYLNIKQRNSNPFKAGNYPDGLIPISNYLKKYNNIKVAQGKNQGFLFDVKIPANTPAGIYKGNVEITIGEVVNKVPVEFTVWNFTLPNENHFESYYKMWTTGFEHTYPNMNFWDDWISAGNKVTARANVVDLMGIYNKFLLDYRVVTAETPYTFDDDVTFRDYYTPENIKSTVANIVKYLKDNPQFTSFRIPFNNRNDDFLAKSKQIIKGLHEAGVLDKGFIYRVDEVGDENEQLAKQVSDIEKIKTELGISKIRNLVTMAVSDKYTNKVNIWCPGLSSYSSQSTKDQAAERIQQGDEVWWYNCNNPTYPFPTYQIDDNLISSRLYMWMQREYGIQGKLYWGVNIFTKFINDIGVTRYQRNVWEDAYAETTFAGEGYLLYPSEGFSEDRTPYPSLRLISIREGNEDYEYLYLLEQKIKALTVKLNVVGVISSEEILKPIYKKLYTNVDSYTKDPEIFKETRRKIADMIAAIDQDPNSLVTLSDTIHTDRLKVIKVFTVTGATVKVNGKLASPFFTTYTSLVPFNYNENTEVTVEITYEGKTKTQNITFLINKDQDDNTKKYLLYDKPNMWTTDLRLGLMNEWATKIEKSTDWRADSLQSMKFTFFKGVNYDYPAVELYGNVLYQDVSKFKTLEFDIKNGSNKTIRVTAAHFDPLEGNNDRRFDKQITLTANAEEHISIPIENLTSLFKIPQLYVLKIFVSKMDAEIYIDNMYFTSNEPAVDEDENTRTVSFYNAEDDSQLYRWLTTPQTKREHSIQWKTEGSQSLKMVYNEPGNTNLYPMVHMYTAQLPYKEWSDFESIEFDIYNASEELDLTSFSFTVLDPTLTKSFPYRINLKKGETKHISIPISTIYDNLSTYEIGRIMFQIDLWQAILGKTVTVYVDNMHFIRKESAVIVDKNKVSFYNAEDESQLYRWLTTPQAKREHSTQWKTEGSQSLKMVYNEPGNTNLYPMVHMYTAQLPYKEWSNFESIEFDIYNASEELDLTSFSFTVLDPTLTKSSPYRINLKKGETKHISVPISTIYDNLSTYEIGRMMFQIDLWQAILGKTVTVYVDNMYFVTRTN